MESTSENQNGSSREKITQLNTILEELEIKALIQKKQIETFLSSNNNLETNDFELELVISLYSAEKPGELDDDPFYESNVFGVFLDCYDDSFKGYYLLQKEFPNQSFCATLICLREFTRLSLEQILSIETVWYEIEISLQNTNDIRFKK